MPKNIRLNKAVKELNISIPRAVEFLASKGIEIESNPNALLAPEAYSALEAEFKKDGEQKKASNEVVISKVPEEKIELKEEKAPEVIRAKSTEKPEQPKILGKINLNQDAPTEPVQETPAPKKEEEAKPAEEPVEKEEAKQELKVLGQIDISQLEPSKKKPAKKSAKETAAKTEPQPKKEAEAQPKKEKVEKVEASKEAPKTEQPAPVAETPAVEEPQKIETNYQKLEGPKILKEKVDLSQFETRPKKKKKRKRITPAGEAKPADGNANSTNQNKPKPVNKKNDAGRTRGGKKKRNEKTMPVELTEEQVKNQIKETLEKLTNKGGKSKSAKYRKEKRVQRRELDAEQEELAAMDKTLKVTEFITVSELASLMNVSPTEVISACFSLGVMVTMNQRLEADTLTLVAEEFGYQIEFADADLTDEAAEDEMDNPEDLLPRAPIVTVMGHVDHGKTSLLDYIRKTNVIAGESGGITQHIGAYNVKLENGERITFLDTPGHEAFTAMRARGAQVTDIAIIVIAADDDVMPQTKEAISHAQAAGVPMIIALNKVDKPNANPDKIREQLSAMNILVEEWGGNVQSQEISAKFGNNVDLLLEKVLIQAELLELKANPNKNAQGVVIEASLDKGRGYVATMLVQAGTLKVGDYVLAGKNHGKVKAMLDERGKNMAEAGPSIPVTILGLDGAPTAGDKFKIYDDEKEAKTIANKREQLQREQSIRTKKHLTLDEIGRRIALGDFKELNIILKGDVDGSVEALSDMLQRLSTEEIQINILHKGVGQITESDILLATASDAVVIGFNVRAGANAKDLADKEEIEIRTYSVIYDAIDDVKEAMEGMLSPEIREQVIGNVEIREVFKISKVGSIAGCMVLSGKVTRNSKIRLLRDGIVKYDGELESLKRFKDDVREVTKGYECGLNLKGYNDIEIGDILEVYEEVAVKKKLK
ncbi:translation initiation factor IF-2 [Riemerella columbina]|uniref:translation initiation factor IF-2 n=1 Tax=Riemerella columbina TaxID=103810 RepID=UPI00266FB37E|nr:translation initiation factor IF-2 [Riemerella columbina]WKS95118.1 translation initiation factor IF-2 [Riemerella columbina]